MISFTQPLMNRELGLPSAQLKIMEAMDRKTANNLTRDCFHSETIELSQGSFRSTFRCRDFVAFLSGKNVKRLALWSLITRCKLWDFEITQNFQEPNHFSCVLSECGMVLVDSHSRDRKIIVLDGKQTGMLPTLNFYSINLIGTRILGCWAERLSTANRDPFCWLPENSNHFFGEWDQEGRSLSRYQLDQTRGRWTHTYACDENFWVRLSGSNQADLVSIIEVFDRVIGTMKTFELALNPDEEKFTSACIVQNRLFYGKNLIRPWSEHNISVNFEPTICIYDLVKGTIVEEFPTGAKKGEPKQLVANKHYAAWLEYRGSQNDRVKYLDILNKTIKEATIVPCCDDCREVDLNILGTVLSVTYAEGSLRGWANWRRKVIDLTNGELKSEVRYKRFNVGECSMSNGNMLITDCSWSRSRMYVESFVGQGLSNAESSFRDPPK